MLRRRLRTAVGVAGLALLPWGAVLAQGQERSDGVGRALPPVVAIPDSAPAAAAGRVFPVFGREAAFTDDFGAPRAGTGWHQGVDIFAPTGTPVLAVGDGELFNVGVNTLGGNRLWLRDTDGHTYYYAHLSGYAANMRDGTRVRAGQVIAFVGNTGQAISTPPHLHFEIHPGDGASVNPFPYLRAWRRGTTVAALAGTTSAAPPAASVTPGAASRVETPNSAGAVLVGVERGAPHSAAPPDGDGLAVAVP